MGGGQRALLIVLTTLAALVAVVLAVTLAFGAGGWHFGSPSLTSRSTPYRIAPPPGLPKTQLAKIPPLGADFVLPSQSTVATPTPCPTYTLPSAVIRFPTPSGTATTPSPTATSAIPSCGDGQLFGPRCYTVLPGQPPTQDQVRQALFTESQQLSMPFPLIEAIGWQESGWQENVQACDGGVGVMQLQPETTQWLNETYGTNYSAYDLIGNATLGVTLINWLYNYYIPFCNQGEPAGITCDWDTVWPGATDGATIRQIVESAYNEGIGNVANYGIQNWNYVNSVDSLFAQFQAAEPASVSSTPTASPTASGG
jgi:hypothetical protein